MMRRGFLFFVILVVFVLVTISTALALPLREFHVQETEVVRLMPKAVDLDKDLIRYKFSPPLNRDGEWKTGYDDAGEYLLNITASDGTDERVEPIRLIVHNKNRPPVLVENRVVVKEDQTIDLTTLVEDPDEDPLEFTVEEPFDEQGKWTPGYTDEGSFVTTFTVNDGNASVTARVNLQVLHTNHAPEIVDSFFLGSIVSVEEDSTLSFFVEAEDVDKDELSYHWTLDGITIAESSRGEFYFTYDSAGEHHLEMTVTDGELQTSQQWSISVTEKNRPPRFELPDIKIHEGEKVRLSLPKKDEDGDTLTYIFEPPLNSRGEWLTTSDDGGIHDLDVTASDGKSIFETSVEITVENVDRPPVLQLPAKELSLREGEPFQLTLEGSDPDGDTVVFNVTSVPNGMTFKPRDATLLWTPPYDTVHRSGGGFSTLLNKLRLEQWALQPRPFVVEVTGCALDACTSGKLRLLVKNVNRAPQFDAPRGITVTEKDLATLQLSASDPDGDLIHYYYTQPLGKSSGTWQTKYGDRGKHTVWVTATDGHAGTTVPVNVTVLKNNRAPSLKIADDSIVVNENQEFSFSVSATDPDHDELSIALEGAPAGSSFVDGQFSWTPPGNTAPTGESRWWKKFIENSALLNRKLNPDQEIVWLKFNASDGEASVVHPVKVNVKNINRAPKILDFLPGEEVTVMVGEPVLFHVTVKDADGDKLHYSWDFGLGQAGVEGTDTIERVYQSAGKKEVSVVVSDGRAVVEKKWKVTVEEPATLPEVLAGVREPAYSTRIYVLEG